MTRMSFQDAMAFVDDDMPDGAYWALAHELAGLEYGEGFVGFLPKSANPRRKRTARNIAKAAHMNRERNPAMPHRCGSCGSDFATKGAKKRHRKDVHSHALAREQNP